MRYAKTVILSPEEYFATLQKFLSDHSEDRQIKEVHDPESTGDSEVILELE